MPMPRLHHALALALVAGSLTGVALGCGGSDDSASTDTTVNNTASTEKNTATVIPGPTTTATAPATTTTTPASGQDSTTPTQPYAPDSGGGSGSGSGGAPGAGDDSGGASVP